MKFKTDYRRMMGREWKFGLSSIARFFAYRHIRFMWYWRRYEQRKSIFLRLIIFKYAHKYGLEISQEAEIGESFYLGHPYNITVGGNVKMGHHVALHKGATIGNDVLIAPNAYVNFDVSDHSIVIGNPATIHYREGAVEKYIGE